MKRTVVTIMARILCCYRSSFDAAFELHAMDGKKVKNKKSFNDIFIGSEIGLFYS